MERERERVKIIEKKSGVRKGVTEKKWRWRESQSKTQRVMVRRNNEEVDVLLFNCRKNIRGH